VIARLDTLGEAIEQAEAVTTLSMERCPHDEPVVECPICLAKQVRLEKLPTIIVREEDDRIAYESLTLRSPKEDRVLIQELSVSIPHETRVVVVGTNHPAKMALFRATAGIWEIGSGRIVRPGAYNILFLPERPYLLPGTLRQILATPRRDAPTEEQIERVSRAFDLEPAFARIGALDVDVDWPNVLSLGEQQLLAAARVVLAAPRFAFLERPHTTLTPDQVNRVLDELAGQGTTVVTFSDREVEIVRNGAVLERYDAVLEVRPDGSWEWRPDRAATPTRAL
jgi:putative ATP-binding cassette transporter